MKKASLVTDCCCGARPGRFRPAEHLDSSTRFEPQAMNEKGEQALGPHGLAKGQTFGADTSKLGRLSAEPPRNPTPSKTGQLGG